MHLPKEQINEIVQTVVALPGGLAAYGGPNRALFLEGIDPRFVALLHVLPTPALQVRSDLNDMNSLDRLADGSVPLLTWLLNAAALVAGMQAQRVFLRAADDIGHATTGAPRMDPATLPEYKEAIVHEDDMVAYEFMAAGEAAARAVAKLMVPRFENGAAQRAPNGIDPIIYLGTGWLIAANLVVTNHHVVNARNANERAAASADFERQALETVVLFDFDAEDLQGVRVAVETLEGWDATLDYAILRVASTNRFPLRLRPARLQVAPGESVPVNVIQHPRGRSKRYGIRNNLVSGTTARDVRYFTDTLVGSSGSPVLDDGWQVVALHRGSTLAENVKFQGRSTAAVNLGTQIQAVLDDVRARYPALAGKLP